MHLLLVLWHQRVSVCICTDVQGYGMHAVSTNIILKLEI